jgi:hypothetical protein
VRRTLALFLLSLSLFGQAVQPTDNPNQTSVTPNYLYFNKMSFKGAWSSATLYNAQDVVTFSGATYVSLATGNLNQNPATATLWWATVGAVGMTNPMTAQYDVIAGGTAGAATRLQLGSNGSALGASGNALGYYSIPTLLGYVPIQLSSISGSDPITYNSATGVIACPTCAAGMTNPMTTQYDLILGGSAGTPGRLGLGSNGTAFGASGGAAGYYSIPTLLGFTPIQLSSLSATGPIAYDSSGGVISCATCAANNQANTYTGGGLQDFSAMKLKTPSTVVGSLPAAASNTNVEYLVTDGASAGDCTTGGGSTRVKCASNGTAWVALGGGGGSSTPAGADGSIQINSGGSLGAFTASGDSTINTGTGVVTNIGLQGKAVASTAPTTGQMLQYSGTAWTPTTISGGTGTPGGSTFDFQTNSGAGTFNGTGGAFGWNSATPGLKLNISNFNAKNDPNDAVAFLQNCTTSSSLTNPNFSDENCRETTYTAAFGQGNYGPNPNYEAKKTFIIDLMTGNFYGSGQHFAQNVNLNCTGSSDCAASSINVTYAGPNISGDENQGFTTWSYARQQGTLTTTSVISSSPTRTSCNTYITQSAITRSITPQAFTVNSTTGCSVNDWVVLGMEPPTAGQSEQAMQITAVGAGALTGIVRNSYQQPVDTNVSTGSSNPIIVLSAANSNILPGQLAIGGSIPAGTYVVATSGTSVTLTQAPTSTATGVTVNFYFTVTPATVITVGTTANFGQDRYLVNTNAARAYTTGAVSSVSGGGINGTGTSWAYNMAGGSWPLAGCMAMAADAYAGSTQNGSLASTPMNSWYAINQVASATNFGVVSHSVAADASYHGYGANAVTGSITNGSPTLVLNGVFNSIQNGQYVSGAGIPTGTTVASGGGTNTLTLSANATATTSNESITIYGGAYTVAPCARVLYWTGTTVVLESNSFTWASADTVEEAISPYPDVNGFLYAMDRWTPGGADFAPTGNNGRGFLVMANEGARMIPAGVYLQNKMQTGGNADKVSFAIGYVSPSGTGMGLDVQETLFGKATLATATNTTLLSQHPCYAINGGTMGTNTYSGLCGDYTTGRLTLETGRGDPGNSTGTPTVFSMPPVSGTPVMTTIVDDRTGLTASTSPALIAFAPGDNGAAQNWTVCYYLNITTAGTGGSVNFNIRTRDNGNGGAQRTIPSASSLSLAGGAPLNACVPIFNIAGGSADYFATVAGATGSPQYEMHVTVTRTML